MTQLEGDQVDQLLEAVAARLPATWPQWGGGWPAATHPEHRHAPTTPVAEGPVARDRGGTINLCQIHV